MMGRRRALMGSDGGGGVTMKGAASDLKETTNMFLHGVLGGI